MDDGHTVFCSDCGRALASGDAFCSGCGRANLPQHQLKTCPTCSAEYSIEENFCPKDGTRLVEINSQCERAVVNFPADALVDSPTGTGPVSGVDAREGTEPQIDTTSSQAVGLPPRPAVAISVSVDARASDDRENGQSSTGESAASSREPLFNRAEIEGHINTLTAKAGPFWNRHKVLSIITLAWLGSALLAVASGATSDDGPIALLVMFAVPICAAWMVALSNSSQILGGVVKMDGWFIKSKGYLASSNGKIRRWVLYPILWIADKWVIYSRRSPDQFAAASLRVFGYIVTFSIVFMVAYFVIALFVALFLLGIAVMLLSFFLDGPSVPTPARNLVRKGAGAAARKAGEKLVERQRGERIFADDATFIGRRGDKLYRGAGGLFGSEELIGRVDEHGRIYEGTGGLFGSEELIGRIDEDGVIYEGKGGIFGNLDRVGRIDDRGVIQEGSGGIFGHEERHGRIDDEGRIYEGKGGPFGSEDRIGRSKK